LLVDGVSHLLHRHAAQHEQGSAAWSTVRHAPREDVAD
jgi:hypothetical protein